MSNHPYPDFESAEFLRRHADDILAFYEPRAFDPSGGFFHHFLDDGTVYDADTRHLVSSARFVFNYANAYRHTARDHYRDWAAHGLEYLQTRHRTATDITSGNGAAKSWKTPALMLTVTLSCCSRRLARSGLGLAARRRWWLPYMI